VTEAPPRKLYVSQKKLWKATGFSPHPGQKRVLTCPSRFKVTSAGRRFGKSVIGGNRLVGEAFHAYHRRGELEDRGVRMDFWIVGPNYSDSEKEFRVLWNTLVKQQVPFDRPGTYNDPIGGNMHVSLWDGRFQVHGKSAAYPESLVGEGLHGAILAEAAKIKASVWTRFIRPTLNDFTGWAEMTSTPEGKNWFYEMWQRGQDPNQEAWSSFRMPAWVNPYVYKKGATDSQIATVRKMLGDRQPVTSAVIEEVGIDPEVAQLMLDLTEPAFNQEIAAEFTDFVGRVFKEFDEEIHVGDFSYNPDWATYAAVDYGFTNPSVWLLIQVDQFGERIRVLDEVYESQLSPMDFAKEIQRRGLAPSGLQAFYPDPASPGDTRILESVLKVKGRGGTGGELKHRLDAIRQALRPWPAHDPKPRPRLVFDRKCKRTIQDFLDYRYPDRRDEQDKNHPELPMKKDDHGPEALGRFYAGHFGTTAKQARRARVRSSTMTG
jgi:hypothetical protein